MWPAIWPLAIDGLGSLTKKGASLLVMGIVGGAVIPFVFGLVLNQITNMGITPDISNYQDAYWVLIPPYLFILYYAIWGHKIRVQKK
jgi:FHS family L-fucose permease-like MFS transporter